MAEKSLVLAEREGFRTPDTVARMPHFECGAFNRSATSPGVRSLSVAAQYVAATLGETRAAEI